MARNKKKITLLVLLTTFLVSSGLALNIDVNIGEITDHNIVETNYKDEVDTYQHLNFTLENTGSTGCTFQAGLETEVNGEERTAWSDPIQLWPGDSSFLEIDKVYENYTGTVNGTLFLEHCYQTEEIEDVEFEVTENSLTQEADELEQIETETLSATESNVHISSEVEEAQLIPKESPSMWRTSSGMINESESVLNYDTQIFRSDQILDYYVMQNGEIIGQTQIDLESEETILDILKNNVLELVLLLSIIANVGLVVKMKQLEPKKLVNKIKSLNNRKL